MFLEHQDSLFNHIDVRQLPEDLSGIFEFSHLEWVEHRTVSGPFESIVRQDFLRLNFGDVILVMSKIIQTALGAKSRNIPKIK